MSACSATPPDHSDRVLLLRWSEAPGLPMREQSVEIIEFRGRTVLICAPFPLLESTFVHLIERDHFNTGIVRSCHEQGSSFLLSIQIQSEAVRPRSPDIDPGVFVVNDFVTEEEELRILKEIEDEMGLG
jgi:hypothetical protein